jgi:hypothetical protein
VVLEVEAYGDDIDSREVKEAILVVEESTTVIGLRKLIVDHLIKSWVAGERVFKFKICLLHSKIIIRSLKYKCIFFFFLY